MQDVFIEYLVRKRNPSYTIVVKAMLMVASVLVCLLAFAFSGALGAFSFIAVLLGVGAIYGAWRVTTGMNIEFEYSVTNGELDVDKITAQRRRRRMINVNCREVEAFGKYRPAEHAQKQYQTKLFACDYPDNPDLWYCTVRKQEKGLTLVVFNANDRMLEGMKPFLPRQIAHEAFRIGS